MSYFSDEGTMQLKVDLLIVNATRTIYNEPKFSAPARRLDHI